MTKKVAVLMGGWSSECDVSMMSGLAVMGALDELGYEAIPVEVNRDLVQLVRDLTPKPDVVFNALHGQGGEDGVIQGILDTLQIPYTHSGVLASALGMDKLISRELFRTANIPVPPTVYLSRNVFTQNPPLSYPFVVKPRSEGSSIGVYVVHNEEEYNNLCVKWPYKSQKVLVERFIPGREITVAVLNGKALGAMEVVSKNENYDFEAKYTPGKADHIMPAPLPEADYDQVMNYAEHAHRVLGCSGLTRADFICAEQKGENKFYLLEVNTQPGFTPISLAPEIAQGVGISFSQLIDQMLQEARCEK